MNPKQKTMAALLASSPYGAGVARQIDEYDFYAMVVAEDCPPSPRVSLWDDIPQPINPYGEEA